MKFSQLYEKNTKIVCKVNKTSFSSRKCENLFYGDTIELVYIHHSVLEFLTEKGKRLIFTNNEIYRHMFMSEFCTINEFRKIKIKNIIEN